MIRFFAEHPTVANLLMLMFIIMGLVGLPQLRRETFPEYIEDQVQVSVIYPGATAQEVEEAICDRVEDAIEEVGYVSEVFSEAREGVGTVTVTMADGGDYQAFVDDVKTEVEAIDDFPEVCEKPVVRKINRTDQVVSIAVTGPMTVPDLKAYCDGLKEQLQALPDVSLVSVLGFSDHQVRIELSRAALMQRGLSVAQVADIIARQSVDLPAGTLETRDRDILVRFTDERRTPEQFANLVVVGSESGAEIRLGDLARITDRFELDESKIIFNGQRAGLLKVTKTRSEDTLTVFDAVDAFIAETRRSAPPDVNFYLTHNVSSIVRDRLEMLVRNGWQGLLLVFLTMWLFFSGRFSFWVAMGLPVSFLGAFFFMPMFGQSVNMLTMVGLLLGIGLLMDDAIVISENVAVHVAKGASPLEAVVAGTREVKMGVLFSYLTTVIVFAQLWFLAGRIGKVMRVMPVVLILVLTVSLVEAFLILPHHLRRSMELHDPRRRNWLRQRVDAGIIWVREKIFGTLIDFSVDWRYFMLGVAALVFLASVGLMAGGILKFQSFPAIDGDTVQARVLLPQGTPLSRTEDVCRSLTDALERVNARFKPLQPGGQDLILNWSVWYSVNAESHESGPHVATVWVDVLSAEVRNAHINDILNAWREEVKKPTDVISLDFSEPLIGPQGRPIDFTLEGRNLDELETGAEEIVLWLNGFEGVFDLAQDLRPGKPEMRIRLREGATALGLSAQEIAHQLRSAFYGQTAREIQVGREGYEIDVRLIDTDQDSLGDLEDFHVTLPGGKQAPLGSVATMETGRSWARIARLDGRRSVRIQGNVDARISNLSEIVERFENEFLPDFRKRHPSLSLGYKGEVEESAKTMKSIKRGFILGILGIYILLCFQFRSWMEPVIVMLAIPLALVGVLWGHWLMGLNFSLPSMLGFVALGGVVVNDSLLLVEFIKHRRREGMSVADASKLASRQRFRAVVLTSLTTMAGLFPLLAERSLQAQILIPLAVSLVFGLIASTVLVLIILPAFYTVLDDLGIATKITPDENRPAPPR